MIMNEIQMMMLDSLTYNSIIFVMFQKDKEQRESSEIFANEDLRLKILEMLFC